MHKAESSTVDHAGHKPSDIDDMFEMFFGREGRSSKAIGMHGDLGWRPATDVYETDEEFVVQVDLAGMEQEQIEVYVDAGFLIVRGTRSNIAPTGKKHFHKMEIQVGPFERHVRVPSMVDARTAKARYDSGFLFVRMSRGEGMIEERRQVKIENR
ncbi:MAG TPA: Hsp20/alpha crystallin family protein [Candidatus Krumholzibacteria bacterium]|jgi:HSP20 family protein